MSDGIEAVGGADIGFLLCKPQAAFDPTHLKMSFELKKPEGKSGVGRRSFKPNPKKHFQPKLELMSLQTLSIHPIIHVYSDLKRWDFMWYNKDGNFPQDFLKGVLPNFIIRCSYHLHSYWKYRNASFLFNSQHDGE